MSVIRMAASAQQKSLRDRLVGSWNFVVAEAVSPDGKKSFPFGETHKGHLDFHHRRAVRAGPRCE